MKQKFLRIVSKVSMFLTASTLVFSAIAPMAANAAEIQEAMLILSDVTASASANITIQFEAQTAVNASTDTIIVTFPAAWGDIGTGFGIEDFDLETKAEVCSPTSTWSSPTAKTLATAATSATWGVATSTTAVTFTAPTDAGATEITAGDCIRIEIGTNATTGSAGNSQLANPGSTGSHLVAITGAWGDTGEVAVGIVTDATMGVTGDVDPSLTFEVGIGNNGTATTLCTAGSTMSGTSLTLPTIATSTVNRDGYICTRLSTNATDGASVFMDSLNGALISTSITGDTIPDSAQTSVTATGTTTALTTEAYKACVSDESNGTGGTSGTVVIDSEFEGVAGASGCLGPVTGANYTSDGTLKGGEISTSNEAIWSVATPATSVFANLVIMTAISGTTEAHDDYSDTLTFTAVATF